MLTSETNVTMETVARTPDDEAEFSKNASKDLSSDALSPDGLYFRANNQLDTDTNDHLTSLYKQAIENQDEHNIKINNNVSDIFELDEDDSSNENNDGNSMGFFGRLYHQLTRPSASLDLDSFDDEGFTEIDESEITAVINDNADIDKMVKDENKSKSNNSILKTIQSFIDNVNEETDVITGTIDQKTLFNRRSRKDNSS